MQNLRRAKKDEKQERSVTENSRLEQSRLIDRLTRKEIDSYVHKQLALFARFGLGGCSDTPLNDMEFDALLTLGNEMKFPDSKYEKWILEMIETHFPKAFENRKQKGEGWNCLSYFLGAHNKEVTNTPTIKSEIKLCLARRGEILQISNHSDIKKPDIKNVVLLNSKAGKNMQRIGLVRFLDQTEEHVFLDFLPRARIGSRVVSHWSIACSLLE